MSDFVLVQLRTVVKDTITIRYKSRENLNNFNVHTNIVVVKFRNNERNPKLGVFQNRHLIISLIFMNYLPKLL